MRSLSVLVALSLVLVFVAAPSAGADHVPPATAGTNENFELVGHDPLLNRGMNAALAVHGDFAYVGSRTDGKAADQNLTSGGILVVDVSDPTEPTVVNEIGPPNEGNDGETSREMRIWPEAELLIVLTLRSNCSAIIHACSPTQFVGQDSFRFYDISGENAAEPQLVGEYVASIQRGPHEFFLWVDPADPERALMFLSTPRTSTTQPNLIVTDISRARDGEFTEIATFVADQAFRNDALGGEQRDVRLHSIGVSFDGTRTYLAYLGAGMLVLDSSDVAAGVADPELRLITPPANAPRWENMTVHSAVKIPGRNLVLTTDEVYGDLLDPLVRPENEFGCPWGWVHVIDVTDEAAPRLVGEFRTAENEDSFCDQGPVFSHSDPETATFRAYSAHNPTVLENLAFVTWHSGGLQAIRLSPVKAPAQAGFFVAEPLPFAVTEDPALSVGLNNDTKTVAWSFPIIKDGLVYFVDVRNGLYILEYTGFQSSVVRSIDFLEGNSNVGDARRFGF